MVGSFAGPHVAVAISTVEIGTVAEVKQSLEVNWIIAGGPKF
jgi:hypothetical protein